jgi:hypothetical protein
MMDNSNDVQNKIDLLFYIELLFSFILSYYFSAEMMVIIYISVSVRSRKYKYNISSLNIDLQ